MVTLRFENIGWGMIKKIGFVNLLLKRAWDHHWIASIVSAHKPVSMSIYDFGRILTDIVEKGSQWAVVVSILKRSEWVG